MSYPRLLGAGLSWATVVAGLGTSAARAQFPVAAGPPIVMSGPVVQTSAPLVTTETPVVSSRGPTYATPLFSEARRKARTANRYTVARPVYAGRPGVTFSPYSDYYFPRTLGARETVYTASPGNPVPVGYRAFANPGARTPVAPR